MSNTISTLKSKDNGITISHRNGITVTTPSFSIALDPKTASECDYTFVSHAHIDHVHVPSGKSRMIASKQTKELAKLRGYNLGNTTYDVSGIEMLDSGHILGSRAILIKDKVLYTGDLSTRNRAFLSGCRGVKCETLIIESTYGRPHYKFPDTDTIVSQVNKFISDCFDNCRPVILAGYPLGKAQLISHLFDVWEPVYLHESVYVMNNRHIELGVDLKTFEQFSYAKEFQEKTSRGPWVLIAPSTGGRSSFVRSMKEKHNAIIATFTGWALDSRFRSSMNSDRSFPLSDHCDFDELVEFVKYCNPSKIFTVHGFAEEFAAHLRQLGFDAEPLEGEAEPQIKLTNFAR